jgi:hypothetical protein
LTLSHKSVDGRGPPYRDIPIPGFRDGYAERGEVARHGDANLDFRDPTIKVPRTQSLAGPFHAMRLRFYAAPVVQVWLAAPLSSGGRPGFPVGAASPVTTGSNQIVGEPRRPSASS